MGSEAGIDNKHGGYPASYVCDVFAGQSDGCIFVRQILPLKDAIVCDYANQLRIVRFPLVSKVSDMKNE